MPCRGSGSRRLGRAGGRWGEEPERWSRLCFQQLLGYFQEFELLVSERSRRGRGFVLSFILAYRSK